MKKPREEKHVEDVAVQKVQRRLSREVSKTLEAKDISGYKAKSQEQDEFAPWLSEQVWEE